MLRLYAISGPNQPTVYIQARNAEDAIRQWNLGTDEQLPKTFTIQTIDTLESLLQDAPSEFILSSDTSF